MIVCLTNLVAIILLNIFLAQNSEAGAWLEKPDGDFSVYSIVLQNQQYVVDNKITSLGIVGFYRFNEIGYKKNLSFIVKNSYSKLSVGNGKNSFDYDKVGTELGFKHKIYAHDENKYYLSLQHAVYLPSLSLRAGNANFDEKDVYLRTGLAFGYNFSRLEKMFTNLELHLVKYNNKSDIAFKGETTFGYKHSKAHMTLLQAFYDVNAQSSFYIAKSDLISRQKYDQYSFHVSHVYNINEQFALQLSLFTNFISQNIKSSYGVMLSIWQRKGK